MIELKHITKTFNGKKALSDISFSVSEGEIFGFLDRQVQENNDH